MPLSGSDIASKPAGTTFVPDTTAESAKVNSVIDDIYSILNTVRTVAKGYTGASTAEGARNNLGLGAADSPTFAGATLASTNADASESPILFLDRNSASPAASDVGGQIRFRGRDSAANATDYADIFMQITDPTNGSEDASLVLRSMTGGTLTTALTLSGEDATIAGALSADSGAFSGALAAASATVSTSVSGDSPVLFTLENPNTALNTGVRLYFQPNEGGTARSASIRSIQSTLNTYANLEFWTAGGSDSALALTIGTDQGIFTAGVTGGSQGAGTINASALYDDGSLLCAPVEEFVTGSFDRNKWRELAPHGGLAAYVEMRKSYQLTADDFDRELRERRALPGYWSPDEWKSAGRVSISQRIERLLLAMDLMAVALCDVNAKNKALEARVAALE